MVHERSIQSERRTSRGRELLSSADSSIFWTEESCLLRFAAAAVSMAEAERTIRVGGEGEGSFRFLPIATARSFASASRPDSLDIVDCWERGPPKRFARSASTSSRRTPSLSTEKGEKGDRLDCPDELESWELYSLLLLLLLLLLEGVAEDSSPARSSRFVRLGDCLLSVLLDMTAKTVEVLDILSVPSALLTSISFCKEVDCARVLPPPRVLLACSLSC